MVNNRRSELDIVIEILNLSKEGAKKTSILYKSNLSYTQLQSYLPFLIEKEILEECQIKSNGKDYKCYKTTSKGLGLLDAAQEIVSFLK
jgi:predicted transcriptional regulator